MSEQSNVLNDAVVTNVSRRAVLKTLGLAGGFAVAASAVPPSLRGLAGARDSAQGSGAVSAVAGDLSPSVYVAIDEEGIVHAFVHRVEMGQGSRTGMTQVIADELEADWDRINVVPAFGDLKFGNQNTDGSTSIRDFYDAFRQAGASARHMLEDAAAAEWGVDRGQVQARNHQVHNTVTGDTRDYADLVAAAALLDVPSPESVQLKTRAEHRYIGHPVPNIYGEQFVTGTSVFAQDVRREGMLYAVAARPPVVRGSLSGYDREAALAVPGVVDVVELPKLTGPGWGFQPLGGVAVIAENTWAAIKGREALGARFEGGMNAGYDTTEYEQSLWEAIDAGGATTYARGDVDAALASSTRRVSADYFVPHQHHAPMEPPSATAEWDGDDLKIWACCQDPQAVQNTVGPYVGKDPKDIYVEATLLGGAFGRKSKPDFAVEAAVLAKHAGRPVKMIWTREDDVRHGYYHAISAQRIDVGLDESGGIRAWDHRAAYPSLMEAYTGQPVDAAQDWELGPIMEQPFAVPHMRLRSGDAKAHVRVGWMRSVTSIQHGFAVGSMVDEIAHATGRRPDEVWLDLLGSVVADTDSDGAGPEPQPLVAERLGAVFRKVVEMSGYGRTLPERTGIGLAAWTSFGSFTAAALEVTVGADGAVRVPRAWTAIDCGLAVNPDRVRAQMEGAVVFGLSIALRSEITLKDGAVVQDNFDNYQVCRIDEAPEVEVAIFENEHPLGGAGEPGVPPVAPALTNGIFAAVGTRVRRLPLGDQLK